LFAHPSITSTQEQRLREAEKTFRDLAAQM
jgi:hypothetical protein